MKKYFTLLALALVTLVSCDKDEPGETSKKEYDVYITGRLFGEAAGAAYWKNGVKVKLPVNTPIGSGSESIFVSNGDVYITGDEIKDDVLGLSRALYWKNGNKVTLSEDNNIVSSASASTYANSICVVGNDIYIAGGLMKENGESVDRTEMYPVYWKNGELFELTGGASLAEVIRVDGNDVYVLDKEGYWKNGVRVKIPFSVEPKNGYAADIQIVGGDIYVAGSEDLSNGSNIALYWKNGVAVTLAGENASASSIFVSGNDVYVAGADRSTDLVTYPVYWKNGVKVRLSDPGIKSSADVITVLDDNIFISGSCKEGDGYWINEKFHPIGENIFLRGMFVAEKK